MSVSSKPLACVAKNRAPNTTKLSPTSTSGRRRSRIDTAAASGKNR